MTALSSVAIYFVGFFMLIIGLAVAASLLNIPGMWTGLVVIVLIGIGILSAVAHTARRSPPSPEPSDPPPA